MSTHYTLNEVKDIVHEFAFNHESWDIPCTVLIDGNEPDYNRWDEVFVNAKSINLSSGESLETFTKDGDLFLYRFYKEVV